MRLGEIYCDRCKLSVPPDMPVLVLRSLEHKLRAADPPWLLELCEPCGVQLLAWVRAK